MADTDEHIEGQVKDEELDPEREARRRIALAQIRQYPDAALKMRPGPWRTTTTSCGAWSSG